MPTPRTKTGRAIVKRSADTLQVEAETANRTIGVAAAVQQYLESRPGEHVWASDIMTATGFTKGQVQQAVSYLRNAGGVVQIGIIRPGNAWRWNPRRTESKSDPGAVTPGSGQVHIVGVYEGDAVVLTIGGRPYLAKPIV